MGDAKKQFEITVVIVIHRTRTNIVWAHDAGEAHEKSNRFEKFSGYRSNGDFERSKVLKIREVKK